MNIVLITWDSVRADHCSCYGYHIGTTPFLDKIARKGLKFQNAIVSGVVTQYSMGGIFTSEYFNKDKISTERTIAQILNEKGYNTASFHSHPMVSRFFGFNKGFKTFKDHVWKSADGKLCQGVQHSKSSSKVAVVELLKRLRVLNRARKYYNIINIILNRHSFSLRLEDFYDDVLKWVESQRSDDNYFLWIFIIETHFPYVPSTWSRLKKLKSFIICNKFYEAGGIKEKLMLNLSERERKLIIDAYDKCIREADTLVKRLWNDLKDTDPIFIVHADHGDAFGEHGFYGHPPEHYEYLIRVPLVIYNADVKGVVKEPVSLLRLAPTICELAGVENEFSQPSLLEDVEYTPPIVENKLENGLRVTVRDKEWKLIVNPDREDELYNIKKDPMEQENMIGQEPDIEKELRKLAEKHIKTRKEKERLRKRIERLRGI